MNISTQISKLEAKIRKQQEYIDRQEEKLIRLQHTLNEKYLPLDFQSLPSKITREAYDKYFVNNDHMFLVTVTFDPEVLSTYNLHSTELQANYIHKQISTFHDNCDRFFSHDIFIYGSMEFHKSGILHSHFIFKYSKCSDIEYKEQYNNFIENMFNDIKMKFTFKPYNKICIDYQPVKKFYEACEYVEKEPYTLFKFGRYSISVLDT